MPSVVLTSTPMTKNNDIQISTVTIGTVNKPTYLAITIPMWGDFNSHITTWVYNKTDENGDLVEGWSDAHHLSLVHDPKNPCSFNSSRWNRGYNPDISFVSNNIASLNSKAVLEPIQHTKHRPIAILINAAVTQTPFRRRYLEGLLNRLRHTHM